MDDDGFDKFAKSFARSLNRRRAVIGALSAIAGLRASESALAQRCRDAGGNCTKNDSFGT